MLTPALHTTTLAMRSITITDPVQAVTIPMSMVIRSIALCGQTHDRRAQQHNVVMVHGASVSIIGGHAHTMVGFRAGE